MKTEDVQQALRAGDARMGEANGALKQGQPLLAEGSQGAAADHIADAQAALRQALQQAAQEQQQMQSGDSSGQAQSGGSDSSFSFQQVQGVDIPGADEFRSPEEYRRALIEGMAQEVPESFRALKKRYYEALVQQ